MRWHRGRTELLNPASEASQALAALTDRLLPGGNADAVRMRAGQLIDAYLDRRGLERLSPADAKPKHFLGNVGGRAAACSCRPCSRPAAPTRPALLPPAAPELSTPCFLLGYASVFETSYNFRDEVEAVERGAYTAVLGSRLPIAMLYGHNYADQLGATADDLTLAQDDFGLLAMLWPTTPKARAAARLCRLGAATEMSIGRCSPATHRKYHDGQYEQRFAHKSIGEVSLVAHGANGATCMECFTSNDRPRPAPAAEYSLAARERAAANLPAFLRRPAILASRHERAKLRLRRLAARLFAGRVFELSPDRRQELIRRTLHG